MMNIQIRGPNLTPCQRLSVYFLYLQLYPPAAFINRKGFYSINSVVVCDFKNKILHHITRHAGSAHDSRIFNESRLNALLLGQHNHIYIIDPIGAIIGR